MFQRNSENYTYEHNRFVYGDWSVAEVYTGTGEYNQMLEEHNYFSTFGMTVSGAPVTDWSGKNYPAVIGCMDEQMIKLGNIKLNEGRFPQNTDEIVMETSILSELGYSFEIGQDIRLKVLGLDGKSVDKTYKLVGVLKNNTAMWSTGSYMPAALVIKEELDNIKFQPTIMYYYHIKEAYKKVDIERFYDNLIKNYAPDNEAGVYIEYNSYLYMTSFWGTDEIYGFVEKMIMLAGICSMSFLLAAYIQKRKKCYYNLRTIGMSKLQVKLTIFVESACICLPAGIAAFILTIAVGAVISLIITVTQKYSYFYEVPPDIVGKSVSAWLIIFVVSTLIAMLTTSKKRLYGNNQAVSMRFLFKWRMNKLREKHVYSSIFIREHRVFKLRAVLGVLLCMIFTLVLLFASTNMWEYCWKYNYLANEFSDFSAVRISDR